MKPKSFMLIAGEASGDQLAAELVSALRPTLIEMESAPTNDVQPLRTGLAPQFFGAGGPRMAAAGVEMAFDLTQHSVIGISDVLRKYWEFRRLFNRLLRLAIERQPDVIIGVDFGGFNLRFGRAIKQYVRRHRSQFVPWNPKLVQFVSPQVWASRAGRAFQLAADYDLLLSIFPFEKEWYASRVPDLRVEFVGHPMVERIQNAELEMQPSTSAPLVVLLPGSRAGELKRHLPVMLEAVSKIRTANPQTLFKLVAPNVEMKRYVDQLSVSVPGLEVQVGGLPEALGQATIAIASTGTVTMECAFFGVPTVAIYKTSASTYFIGKRLITVKHLAMPNLLANETIYPELIQGAATAENITREAFELLNNLEGRRVIKAKLAQVVKSLGEPGAIQRAAQAVVGLLT